MKKILKKAYTFLMILFLIMALTPSLGLSIVQASNLRLLELI